MPIFDRRISLSIAFFFSCLCVFQVGKAQYREDSSAAYSYLELDNLIYENRHDSVRLFYYLDHYLHKAQREKNVKELVNYYKDYVFYRKKDDRLLFVDSALYFALQTHDNGLIGSVYLTKGIVYYNIKDYQQALDYHLIANDFIAQTDDIYNKYRIKNMIGGIKNYLGYYEDAGTLFRECLVYFGQEEANYNMHRGYTSSVLGLAWSYTKTGRIAESAALLTAARESAEKMGFSDLDVHYLVFKQGINDYFLGDYEQAVRRIEQQLPFLYENEDFAWASIGEFYIGKSRWDQGEREKAIVYFDKINEVFRSRHYTHPDLREAYELLISYYKAQDDKDQQLKYISQLVKVDSVFSQNHKYLLNNIHKKYSTRELVLSLKRLKTALYIQKNKTILITGVSVVLLAAFGWTYYQHKKTKKIAQELIRKVRMSQDQSAKLSVASPPVPENIIKGAAQVKEKVVVQLLNKLSQFEQKQRFLKPHITLEKLAGDFGTNSSYLSHVINTYKSKSFTQYLNTLRIKHVINQMVLHPDTLLRKYSVDSIATDCGFNSAAAFSRAFQQYAKVRPSDFIRELKKKKA